MKFKSLFLEALLVFAFLLSAGSAFGQVTTSEIKGNITDEEGEPLIGATVVAVHEPSGSTYGTVTNLEGNYNLPGVRPGGPYSITVTYVGYGEKKITDVNVPLGAVGTYDLALTSGVELEVVEVVSAKDDAFSSQRKGVATNINTETINAVPTLSRDFTDFFRLSPQASTSSFGTSFGGQDNRLNNITVDGTNLNSAFGLSGTPGGRTSTSAISLDAVDEVQVNMAPYDVRLFGFVGASVNAVTRSGTNNFEGSVFYNLRNENLVGRNAAGNDFDPGNFNNQQIGFRLGGPIVKDKLFFFVNGEFENGAEPAVWTANRGGEPIEGTKTRVLASDLDRISQALFDRYGYNTGPFEGYDLENNAQKFLAKLSYNLSDKHKLSLRYNTLTSELDRYISNSGSLGEGNRRTRPQALSFQNSNYVQTETIHSVVGEWNAIFSSKASNKLLAGWTYQNEDRGQANAFPLIDILEDGQTYTSVGTDPFTPQNSLEYTTFQLQDNLSLYFGDHTLTAGVNLEYIQFENLFFPGSFGVWSYNSVDDFIGAIGEDDPVAGPPDSAQFVPNSFEFRYSALAGGAPPVAKTNVFYGGVYVQDEWRVNDRLDLTLGLRLDIPAFGNTALENPAVSDQNYLYEGDSIRINTGELPATRVLFSPRFGFNYKLSDRFQIRGGSGLFTGRPAFVWISNQVSNNGVLTGFDERFEEAAADRPFTTDPIRFIDDPSAGLPETFQIDVSDPQLRFPQTWRSNLAVDVGLFWGLVGTVEFIYNRDINNLRLTNINLANPSGGNIIAGPDNRPLFLAQDSRINSNTTAALYLTPDGEARSYNFTVQIEKPFDNGLFFRVSYNYGNSKNLIDLGSTTGSWFNSVTVAGNNELDLTFSQFDQRHRLLAALNYGIEYAGFMGTQVGFIFEAASQGRNTYSINGDINGDFDRNNDALFVPNSANDIQFEEFTSGGVTYTVQQQREAFDQYIEQDPYLSTIRGQYSERNGLIGRFVPRLDVSLVQKFFLDIGGDRKKRNELQVRLDIINFTNMISSNWGVGYRVNQTSPLQFRNFDANGEPVYRMATFGNDLLRETFGRTAGLSDVWQMQIGLRYIFGN